MNKSQTEQRAAVAAASLTARRSALAAAEADQQNIARRCYAQREAVKAAINADVMDRFGGTLPRPRGLPDVKLPPTPLQVERASAQAALDMLEMQLSNATARLTGARGALLAAEEHFLTGRREVLAEQILSSNGLGCDAALAELVALCPDATVTRLDQQFTKSQRVRMALAHRPDADRNAIDTPINVLQGGVGAAEWKRARARVLAESEETPSPQAA